MLRGILIMFNISHDKYFAVFPSGYRVSKVLVWLLTGLLLLYLFLVLLSVLSHDRFYLLNDNPGSVENPFYLSDNVNIPSYLSNMEYLPPGFEVGYNHGSLVASANVYSLLLLLFGLLINHLLFNRRGR